MTPLMMISPSALILRFIVSPIALTVVIVEIPFPIPIE